MEKEPQIAFRDASSTEDLVLLRPDEVTTLEEIEVRRSRAQTIARLRLLWQNRLFLSKTFLGGLLAFFLIAFLIPSRYDSTAQLMPPDQQSGTGLAMFAALMGKTGAGLMQMGSDLLGMKTSGELFVGVLESRRIQDDLINKFNLRSVYWDRKWEDARKDLARHTDISTDRKSGILTITVTDRSPKRAAAMGKEYIDQLNLVMAQLDTSQAHRERVFLEARLQEVKQELETAEKRFGEFASKNVALDIPTQGKAMVEAAAALEGELVAAQTELQGLRQIYSDNNVRVRSAQARISELQGQLQKLGGKAGTTAEAEVSDPESIYPSIRRLPLLGVTYADLLRRTKVQEAIFETLTQEYELAKVEEAKELPTVKVLDIPNVPEKKSFPPRTLITLVGAISVLLCGIAWVLARQQWHETSSGSPAKLLVQDILTELHEDVTKLTLGRSVPQHADDQGQD